MEEKSLALDKVEMNSKVEKLKKEKKQLVVDNLSLGQINKNAKTMQFILETMHQDKLAKLQEQIKEYETIFEEPLIFKDQVTETEIAESANLRCDSNDVLASEIGSGNSQDVKKLINSLPNSKEELDKEDQDDQVVDMKTDQTT